MKNTVACTFLAISSGNYTETTTINDKFHWFKWWKHPGRVKFSSRITDTSYPNEQICLGIQGITQVFSDYELGTGRKNSWDCSNGSTMLQKVILYPKMLKRKNMMRIVNNAPSSESRSPCSSYCNVSPQHMLLFKLQCKTNEHYFSKVLIMNGSFNVYQDVFWFTICIYEWTFHFPFFPRWILPSSLNVSPLPHVNPHSVTLQIITDNGWLKGHFLV